MIKPKGLKEILGKDKSLTASITYEEFNCIESGFDDSGIKKSYEEYKRALKIENTVS